ncbi:hypothetical protein G155_00078 [Mycobacterium sp. VKM Ac-1817D]|nr:hypothetical protein G155_00078 [Mycobacterium sp. VKM Ac-1817D]
MDSPLNGSVAASPNPLVGPVLSISWNRRSTDSSRISTWGLFTTRRNDPGVGDEA